MKKIMTSIFAVCMMLFVSAACFAKSPKAYYKVDCFSDITGTWEAEQDGEKAKLIITKNSVKAIDSNGEEMVVSDYDEFAYGTAGIIVATDGSEFQVFVDDETTIVFYPASK